MFFRPKVFRKSDEATCKTRSSLFCNVIVNKTLPITSWFVLEYLIVCFDPDYVIFADFYGQ